LPRALCSLLSLYLGEHGPIIPIACIAVNPDRHSSTEFAERRLITFVIWPLACLDVRIIRRRDSNCL
jgi:hypothetical protein